MEWRIIVPVLCLIGILHVPGNAAQTNSTNNSTNSSTVYRFSLHFSINDIFQSNYTDNNNNDTINLKNSITSQVEPLYRLNYTNFERFDILRFSNGSIVTEGELKFSNGTKPNVTDLVQILSKGNFTFTIIKNSINITDITPLLAPATTAAPVTNQTVAPTTATNQTEAPAPAKVAKINLLFKIDQTFKEIYSNLSEPETKNLSNNIITQFSAVYKKRFPKFHRMFIQKFSQGSVAVDSVLEFDTTNGSSAPNASEVKDTLTEAIKNGNFSFTVNSTSISATDITDTNVTTTAPSTSTTTQATTVSAASTLKDYNITFKMNEVFSSDLSNMTSAAAIKLANNVTTELNGFCKGFKNFNRSLVWRFRNGSVVVDALLGFINNGVNPTVTEMARGIAEAVRNGTIKLTADPKSINVTDTSTGQVANRSPVLASMLTALWMTLASLLLSAVMH